MQLISAFKIVARSLSVAQMQLFWCLCLITVVAFVTSFALSIASANATAQLFFALLAILTTTAMQKFTVLELVVILLYRQRPGYAMILEALLR